MKAIALVTIMLLLVYAAIFANGDPCEAEEQWRKTQELNQLADRFKAETGFNGQINYRYESMSLGSFEGNFADIPFSADADTTTFRHACNRILDKILPYSFANRSQLSMNRITKSNGYISTDYYQLGNGYRVEGLGFIVITYDTGRNRFSIGDNAVELPTSHITPVISFMKAVQIAKDYYINNLGYPEDIVINPATESIAYVEFNNQYELCYVLGIPDPNPEQFKDYTIVIDAMTGEVRALRNLMRYLNCQMEDRCLWNR